MRAIPILNLDNVFHGGVAPFDHDVVKRRLLQKEKQTPLCSLLVQAASQGLHHDAHVDQDELVARGGVWHELGHA